MFKETDLPESHCPHCGKLMEAATSVGPRHVPQQGDIALCIGCTAILVFDHDLKVRQPTADELEGIAASQTVMQAQRTLIEYKRRRA